MCKFNFLLNTVNIKYKNILVVIIKVLIGLISFYVIYHRLTQIPHLKEQFLQWLHEPKIIITIIVVFLLMPINWGIECLKWKLITHNTEIISYKTAVKSVFTGICLGNIAPGRAMEFIAKIYFFKPQNKPSITILHFINGMFQMLITVIFGVCAMAYKFNNANSSKVIFYSIIGFGCLLVIGFCLAIFNITFIQQKLKFIKWFKITPDTPILEFSKTLILKLLLLSVVRYATFTAQFYVLYNCLSGSLSFLETFTSIAGYFMLTSIIPMVSFIEPAIRAAIALFVFSGAADTSAAIIISSTLLWLVNVVLPSLMGYIIILKEKINFKTK